MPLSWGGGAIHWQVAQATSMQNIVMNMRVGSCATNKQQGIFMENGSGGFMRDLIMNGGLRGFLLGSVIATARGRASANNMQQPAVH